MVQVKTFFKKESFIKEREFSKRNFIVVLMLLILFSFAYSTNYTIQKKTYCYDNYTLGENVTLIENSNTSFNQTLTNCPFGCENGYCKENPIDTYLFYMFIFLLFFSIVVVLVRYIK
jgi:hypothetical protein